MGRRGVSSLILLLLTVSAVPLLGPGTGRSLPRSQYLQGQGNVPGCWAAGLQQTQKVHCSLDDLWGELRRDFLSSLSNAQNSAQCQQVAPEAAVW